MQEKRSELISPVVDYMCPHLSDAEKEKVTAVVRPYFRTLYEIMCRLEREKADSPDRKRSATVESENPDNL